MYPLYIKFIGNNQNAKIRIADEFKNIFNNTVIFNETLSDVQKSILENVICKPLENQNAFEWQKELLSKYKKQSLTDICSSVYINLFPLEEISFYNTLFTVHNYMNKKQSNELEKYEKEAFELVEDHYFKKCKVIYIYVLDSLNPVITTIRPENMIKFQMKQNFYSLIYHHKKTKRFKNKCCLNGASKGHELYHYLKKHLTKNYQLFNSKNKVPTFDKWD